MEFTAFLQAVPPSPGHGEAAPAPHAGTAPPDGAPGAPPGGALGTFMPLLFVLPMILVMLWMNRSQQKKQKELEDKLKVGDRVITQSGLVGKLGAVQKVDGSEVLTLEDGAKTYPVPLEDVVTAKLVFEFGPTPKPVTSAKKKKRKA